MTPSESFTPTMSTLPNRNDTVITMYHDIFSNLQQYVESTDVDYLAELFENVVVEYEDTTTPVVATFDEAARKQYFDNFMQFVNSLDFKAIASKYSTLTT